METGESLFPSKSARSGAQFLGSEARSADSSTHGVGSTLHLSFSEEVDVETVSGDSPPHSPQYEELLKVVTHAVAKLNIDLPSKKTSEPQKSKLDE